MKRVMKWIGRILLWLFAAWGVFISGALIVFWVRAETPLGCAMPASEPVAPGSALAGVVEKMRLRAIQKYPTIDFSKRKIELQNYEDDRNPKYLFVTYNEPWGTNIFGCIDWNRPPPGVSIAGRIRTSDLVVVDGWRIEEH